MKKLLFGSVALIALTMAESASAADMPVKAPPTPICIWCGWYVGVNGGGGFGYDPFISTEYISGALFTEGTWPGVGNFGTLHSSGGFGGGQIGYNWQTGHYVYGLEADLQGAGIRGSQSATLSYIVAPNVVTEGLTSDLDWFGTVRGRVGYAWDRFLVFATGGLAFGEIRNSFSYIDTFGYSGSSSSSSTRAGYTVGAGVEYAFASKWSAKLEYQYIDLGTTVVGLNEFLLGGPSPYTDTAPVKETYNIFRLGLNYHL